MPAAAAASSAGSGSESQSTSASRDATAYPLGARACGAPGYRNSGEIITRITTRLTASSRSDAALELPVHELLLFRVGQRPAERPLGERPAERAEFRVAVLRVIRARPASSASRAATYPATSSAASVVAATHSCETADPRSHP